MRLQLRQSSVSHELLTPLKCIIIFAEELLPQQKDKSNKKRAQLIYNTAKLLNSQVQETLDRNLIGKNMVYAKLSYVSLANIVQEAVTLLAPQANFTQVSLKYYGPEKGVSVQIDHMRVMQILINFISNAIKFSPKNSTIIVMLKQIESSTFDGFCYYDVSVVDQGIGMSEDDVANLFKPYFRTKDKISRELNMNSHGLGLNISMSIAKILGYNITVESSPGQGSTFTLKLKFEGRAGDVDTKVIRGRK